MLEGQVATEKEIQADGFNYEMMFGDSKVFTKPNTILYWNMKTSKVERIYTYEGKVSF
jgi:hypothetical protein